MAYRVCQAGALLAGRAYRDLPAAAQLADQVEDYTAASVVRALPAGQTP